MPVPVSQTLTRVPRAVAMDYGEEVTEGGHPGGEVMTHYATRSALVAEEVQSALEGKRYGGRPGRTLRIAEPDGPSTDGGLKARQAILLVPVRGDGAALPCGWLDAAKMTSQLRSWDAIEQRHRARYGAPPDLPRASYETFLLDIRRALLSARLDVQLVTVEEQPPAPAPAVAPVTGISPWAAGALATATFIAGYLLAHLLR